MNYSIFLLIIVNLLVGSADARAKMKKYIWLQELKPCEKDQGSANLNGSFVYTGQGTVYINVDLNTPKDIEQLYFFADLKRCPTKLKTDDCEDLMSFPAGDQCNPNNAYFRYFYSQFHPAISCPLRERYYRAEKISFDSEMFAPFFRGMGDEDWLLVKLESYSDEKKLSDRNLCTIIMATMKKIRIQEKTNRNRKQ
ncbi:uncharacterized protein [Halyomorpha halys]|uniref:uncharacterized protein isoform X3 n=1 Tax=Halyomorpha halys TaxID=286706 RepID=UPI0006D4D070|nr:uncharacterized protein LOC106683756 [Halyomorpha halys]